MQMRAAVTRQPIRQLWVETIDRIELAFDHLPVRVWQPVVPLWVAGPACRGGIRRPIAFPSHDHDQPAANARPRCA